MIIEQVYKMFPTEIDCIHQLERIYWNGEPTCPYCMTKGQTSPQQEVRHHCNACNTSFSVTVGTIFHQTRIDLQKWFLAIYLVCKFQEGIGPRQLAREIEVNKNTAMALLAKIRDAFRQENKAVLKLSKIMENQS